MPLPIPSKRTFLKNAFAATGAATAFVLSFGMFGPAWAAYPDRPITLIVPQAVGSGGDTVGRLLAKKLGDTLGVQVVVENKPGAATFIAAQYVTKAKPDGYTILMNTTAVSLFSLRKETSSLDLRKDLKFVGSFAHTPLAIMANPNAPFNNLPELVTYAKANPGKLSYGVNGAGSIHHLTMEYISSVTSIKMVAIPYQGGGSALTGAVLAGEPVMSMDSLGVHIPLIRDGKLKLIATTGRSRSRPFPNVMTVAETLGDFEAGAHMVVMVPTGTPQDVVDKIFTGVRAMATDADTRTRLSDISFDPTPSLTSAEFDKIITVEMDRWNRVAKESGLKFD